jgi:hypothetical protein
MGEVLRDGKLTAIYTDSGKREYRLKKDDYELILVVGERKNFEREISLYSNKNLGKTASESNYFNPSSKDYTITYKPKTTYKEWLKGLENER